MPNNFNVTAGAMLESARTMRALFLNDKALFTAFDADFADPFAADWLTSIETSEATETAETRLDQQRQETEDVNNVLAQAAQVYTQARYFIQKAYSDKPNKQYVFGLNDFTPHGTNQRDAAIFFANLYEKCNSATHKPDLLAAGMTQAQIDAIKTVLDLFNAENTEQNEFIVRTAEASFDRSEHYNNTYQYMQKVNRASKVVFYGNAIKLNQYLLPHGSEGQDYVVEGKVQDGSNNNAPLNGCLVEILGPGLTTTTNSAGNFGFVALNPGNYTARVSRAGYTTVEAPFTLSANSRATLNIVLQLAP